MLLSQLSLSDRLKSCIKLLFQSVPPSSFLVRSVLQLTGNLWVRVRRGPLWHRPGVSRYTNTHTADKSLPCLWYWWLSSKVTDQYLTFVNTQDNVRADLCVFVVQKDVLVCLLLWKGNQFHRWDDFICSFHAADGLSWDRWINVRQTHIL